MTILVTGCLNRNVSVQHIPHSRRVRQYGYSLLELMIVMVVIGVVTSIAALSFSNLGAGVGEKALERLRLDVQLLSNEAIVRSEVLALAFHNKGYAFMRLDEGGENWEVIEKDHFLKPREFEAPMEVRMLIGEEEPELGDSIDEPQIISLPTGEVTPFVYQLVNEQEDYTDLLEFDALGRVVKKEENEDKDEQSDGTS